MTLLPKFHLKSWNRKLRQSWTDTSLLLYSLQLTLVDLSAKVIPDRGQRSVLNLTFSNSVYSFYDGSCHPIKRRITSLLTQASRSLRGSSWLLTLANGIGLDLADHTILEIQSGSDISQQDRDNILSLAPNSLKWWTTSSICDDLSCFIPSLFDHSRSKNIPVKG